MSGSRGRALWTAITSWLLLAPGPPAAAAPAEVRRLDNGLRVAVFSDHRVPLVQVHLLVGAGACEEEPLEDGAAQVAARMLARGTSSRSSAQFSHDLELLGATFSSRATRDFASVSAVFRADDLEHGLDLIADAAIHPIFQLDQFREVRRNLMREVLESRGRLQAVADEHAWALVMRGHRYARAELGTLEGLAALTRERVAAFHLACYRPDRALLAVAGDVDPDRVMKAVEASFARWAGKARPEVSAPIPTSTGPRRIRIVDAPGAASAEIRMAFPAPSYRSEDAYAATVLDDLLGGGPFSRLGADSDRGPRAYSRYQPLDQAGLLLVGTTVSNDSVAVSVARLRRELERFVAEPPTENEVERSRRAIARALPIQNETAGAQAAQWLSGALAGREQDYADRYPARLQAVTADEVHTLAGRILAPERAEIVVVGAAAALKPQLEALGTVEVLTLQDPVAPSAVAPSRRMDDPDPEAIQRGREMIQQAVAAHGGLGRLQAVKDSRTEADITVFRGDEAVTGRQVEVRREPGQLRLETVFMQISTVQVLDGDHAWSHVSAPGVDSTMDQGPDDAAALRHQFSGDIVHLLLTAADPRSRVAFRGREDMRGTDYDVVEVISPNRTRVILLLDPASHRVMGAEENEGSALRGPALRRLFADPRTVQGIVWPHFEERLVDGERAVSLVVRSVHTNSGIDASLFRRAESRTTTSHPLR